LRVGAGTRLRQRFRMPRAPSQAGSNGRRHPRREAWHTGRNPRRKQLAGDPLRIRRPTAEPRRPGRRDYLGVAVPDEGRRRGLEGRPGVTGGRGSCCRRRRREPARRRSTHRCDVGDLPQRVRRRLDPERGRVFRPHPRATASMSVMSTENVVSELPPARTFSAGGREVRGRRSIGARNVIAGARADRHDRRGRREARRRAAGPARLPRAPSRPFLEGGALRFGLLLRE